MNDAIIALTQRPVEHAGQRVITLAQMDEAHGRAKGTAKRNFRQHRDRLLAGVHYFEASADEIRPHFGEGWTRGGSVVLLTERGYLMLAKSFTDDLAWQVQDQLVEAYFRPRAQQMDAVTALCGLLADQNRRMDRLEARLDEHERRAKNVGRLAAFPGAHKLGRKRKPKLTALPLPLGGSR